MAPTQGFTSGPADCETLLTIANYPNVPAISLSVVQQPQAGFVPKSYDKKPRPIEPPPIVELESTRDPKELSIYTLMLICEVYHETEDRAVDAGADMGKALFNRAASPEIFKDSMHRNVMYFSFEDLFVPQEGKFRLKFTLYQLIRDPGTRRGLTFVALNREFSHTFTGYPHKFGARDMAHTPLMRQLASQGFPFKHKRRSGDGRLSSLPARGQPYSTPDTAPGPSVGRKQSAGATGSAEQPMWVDSPTNNFTMSGEDQLGQVGFGFVQQPGYIGAANPINTVAGMGGVYAQPTDGEEFADAVFNFNAAAEDPATAMPL